MAGYAALVVLGYLLGAIPSGLIAGKMLKGIDIRQYGSGKVGATNTLRTLGKGPSIAVLLADMVKAVLAVLLARWLTGSPGVEVAAALAAIVGHNWPAYIGWRGGRGVSSSFGVLILFSPLAALVCLVTFVGVIAWSRYVSLGSLVGSAVGCVMLLGMVITSLLPTAYAVYALLGAALIIFQHRDNIERLWRGTERKLGQKAETASS